MSLSIFVDYKYDLYLNFLDADVFGLFGSISLIASYFLYQWLGGRGSKSKHILTENFYKTVPKNSLILRSGGDEASGLLGTTSFIQWTLMTLMSKASFFAGKIEEKEKSYSKNKKIISGVLWLCGFMVACFIAYQSLII